MLVRRKFRACSVEWGSRFFQRRVVFCPGGKQKSKTSAANCWPTSGKFYVANRKQSNRTAGQSESECRQRWGGRGGRPERQIKLEIASRYFGQGGEQSRLTGAGGGNAERESIARAFARSPQQHGAGGKRRI